MQGQSLKMCGSVYVTATYCNAESYEKLPCSLQDMLLFCACCQSFPSIFIILIATAENLMLYDFDCKTGHVE